jgi:HAD superfamily hydrolase (TIGR01549 family)
VIQAVIFDLDGTVVDSNDLHVEAWREAFREYGKDFPADELHHQIGKGGDKYLPEFLSERELREFGKELEQFRADLFKRKYIERVRPFPKVKELFERIRNDGKRIALASSGNETEVEHYVELAALGSLIESRTSKNDVAHSKPDPDVFTSALHLLHLPPQDAVVIGDTPYDVQAAKKIELPTIGLLCGGFSEDELRASGAIAIYRDPADLLESYMRSPLCG